MKAKPLKINKIKKGGRKKFKWSLWSGWGSVGVRVKQIRSNIQLYSKVAECYIDLFRKHHSSRCALRR